MIWMELWPAMFGRVKIQIKHLFVRYELVRAQGGGVTAEKSYDFGLEN
jgi:hypothetical protein